MKRTEVIDKVVDQMDQDVLFGIIGKNSIIALGITIVIAFISWAIVTYLLPGAGSFSIPSYISMVSTVGIVVYVYRNHIFGGDKLQSLFNITGLSALAIIYSTIMYIGGEVIVISLIGIGIAITIALLVSECGFTAALTWRDLKKWVHSRSVPEQTVQKDVEDDGKEEHDTNS